MTNNDQENNDNTNIWKELEKYFIAQPEPIIGAKTIQILIIREILDYAAFRTEDTKELNTMVTPTSVEIKDQISRVAFLASKQKAAENREMERMLRTAINALGEKDKKESPFKDIKEDCYLKDNLCRKCPRCILHGATALNKEANIKHRIEYSTATSLLAWNDIEETITFNAINDKNISTGQALGTRYLVKPASIFPSIITLKSITKEEFILAVKTLLSCKSYGAETRIGGDIRNHIVGIVAGWEEVITSLEFTLELYDKIINATGDINTIKKQITSILGTYKEMAGNKNKIIIEKETEKIIKAAQERDLDKIFLKKVYEDAQNFYNSQNNNKKKK